MPATTPRHTVAALLACVLHRDTAHTVAETVYSTEDFDAAVTYALPLAHLDGRPFHMAADLLGVSAPLLAGVLEVGADGEKDCATGEPDAITAAEVMAGSDALRAAAAMYEAESAPPIDQVKAEADRIGGGTANAYLSTLLSDATGRLRSGQPLNALDLAAIDEAATRMEENSVNDDQGDYYGPGAVIEARNAGYTLNERAPGSWSYIDPDGHEDKTAYDTEAEAWDAAAADHACSGEA